MERTKQPPAASHRWAIEVFGFMTTGFVVLLLALAVQGCARPKTNPSLSANPVHTFRGSFGESFNYQEPLAITYNPHGGANEALFSYHGTPVGMMRIVSPLPSEPDEVFVDVVVEATKKIYGATNVTYQPVTNAAGYVLHRFASDAHLNGASYRYLAYMYFENRQFTNLARAMLSKLAGTHRFEWVVPDAMYSTVQPHFDFVIDSFKPPVDRGK